MEEKAISFHFYKYKRAGSGSVTSGGVSEMKILRSPNCALDYHIFNMR